MNKVLMIGRLVRDPFVSNTPSGFSLVRFTVAVNRDYNRELTDFVPMVAWRNTADYVSNYVKKGALVSVDGYFTSSSYQNSEGINITRYEVTVNNINLLEPKRVDAQIPPSGQTVRGLENIEFERDPSDKTNSFSNTGEQNNLNQEPSVEPKEETPSDNNSKTDDKTADVPWDIEF